MANGFDLPEVFPAPLVYAIGQNVAAGTVDLIAGALNYAIAELHAAPIAEQQWGDDMARWSGAETPGPIVTWYVPIISSAHLSIRVWARCERDNVATGGGEVVLRSVTAGDEVVLSAGTTMALQGPDTLDIADGGAGYETVEVYLRTTLAGVPDVGQMVELRVESAGCEYVALASPVPTDPVSDATGRGRDVLGDADNALAHAKGRDIIEALTALLARARVLQAWSRLSEVEAYNGGLDVPGMPEHGIETYAPSLELGAFGDNYTAIVETVGAAGGSHLYVDDPRSDVVIPAADPNTVRTFATGHSDPEATIDLGGLAYVLRRTLVRLSETEEPYGGCRRVTVFGP